MCDIRGGATRIAPLKAKGEHEMPCPIAQLAPN
jgi:hypothetical protein